MTDYQLATCLKPSSRFSFGATARFVSMSAVAVTNADVSPGFQLIDAAT